MYRQEFYLKNFGDWELARRDVKSLEWNEIIRSLCPVTLLNETLLHILKDRVSKRTIVIRTGDKPSFDDRCVQAHREK